MQRSDRHPPERRGSDAAFLGAADAKGRSVAAHSLRSDAVIVQIMNRGYGIRLVAAILLPSGLALTGCSEASNEATLIGGIRYSGGATCPRTGEQVTVARDETKQVVLVCQIR